MDSKHVSGEPSEATFRDGIGAAEGLENLIHQSGLEAASASLTPPEESADMPEAWTSRNTKSYPRMPKVRLPRASIGEAEQQSLGNALDSRNSTRDFGETSIASARLGHVLDRSLSPREEGLSRPYPSAGARWGLEVYLMVRKGDSDISSGVYHYQPDDHELALLTETPTDAELAKLLAVQRFTALPPVLAIFTIAFPRLWAKYGARGSRFAYLEAGAAAMTLDLVSTASGLATLWIGGFDDGALMELLDLNFQMELESPVLRLGLGYSA